MSYKTVLDASMMGVRKPVAAGTTQSTVSTGKRPEKDPAQTAQKPTQQSTPQQELPQQSEAVQNMPQQSVEQIPAAAVSGVELVSETAGKKLTAPDLRPLRNALDEWESAANRQARNAAESAMRKAVAELERAQTEAAAMYDTQRAQIALDEANARDNQTLYAQARGDKGGIAAAQYDAIANTAARNRMAVNSAQVKLAADTAQKVAELRAQGEFEIADSVLRNAQQKLSQLISLEKWGLESGLSVDQFNLQLDKWAAEQTMEAEQNKIQQDMWSAEQAMKAEQNRLQQERWEAEQALAVKKYNSDQRQQEQELWEKIRQNQLTAERKQQELAAEQAELRRKQLAQSGQALLEAEIMPSASQLEAMGITAEQARQYINATRFLGIYDGEPMYKGIEYSSKG
ncbi:MAG: hypothetical protein PUB51_00530 [Oscillospiraceae bacterium]|nr:hypothetical protein [Oscillospiraceae bacterium]